MCKRIGGIAAVCFFVMWWGLDSASALGAMYDETHATNMKRNPEGVSLTVYMEKNTFFIGERIPVKLLIQNNSQTEYEVWTGTYDRSGRIQNIGFIVDGPAGGFVDPLKTFFGGIITGGGIGNYEASGQYSQSFDLNEWVRFDLPGTYRLYGATSRVVSKGNRHLFQGLPLYSPIITFQIEKPDDAWITSKIAAAVANPKSRSAVRALGFLGDPRAIQQLVPILGDTELGGSALLGIMGAKDPYQVKAALLENLRDPYTTITNTYFRVMVDLLIPPEKYSLPLRSFNPEFQTAQQAAQKQAIDELTAALPLKRGRALGETCNVLFQQGIDPKAVQEYCSNGK